MPKPEIERTHPLIWCLAFICIVLTVGVIIAGMAVFIGYLAYKPKAPSVSISYAHLDAFSFDPAGVLSTKLTIVIDAENYNKRTASFYDFRFFLKFAEMEVARLKADPFQVQKNKTVSLNYVVDVSQIPMNPRRKNIAESYLRKEQIRFQLYGHARVWWRVGPLIPVKTWCTLGCSLQFQMDGSSIGRRCTSAS